MKWPTWADLRTIGNSAAVRASIVVPVIGYLLVLNATVADYMKMHGIEAPVWTSLNLWDHLWGIKLYLVYFGLMFLGVGSAIYQWKCPYFIKKYGDWADYVAGVAPHTHVSNIDYLSKITGIHVFDLNTSDQQSIPRLLQAHYSIMSNDLLLWRIAATILFSVGFGLLIVPSGMTAIRVASVVF